MYKGGIGMWSWILHRVTGVGIALFLLIHILDTVVLGWNAEFYNDVMKLYTHPLFRLGEIVLVGMVIFHALNGIRIILVNLWSKGSDYQKQLFYIELVLFAIVFVPAAIYMLSTIQIS